MTCHPEHTGATMTKSSSSSAVVHLAAEAAPVLPPAFTEAAGDLQLASRAIARIPGGEHDITAILQATIVCVGRDQLEAVQAVAEFVMRSPRAEIHNIAWARVPLGPSDGPVQYQATLTVSYQDVQGETTGVTHHASRPER